MHKTNRAFTISASVLFVLLGALPVRGQTYRVLYSFPSGTGGAYPSGVISDPVGNLYGAVSQGGDLEGCEGYGCGMVFKLETDGVLTVLHSFTGGLDGAVPVGVTLDSEGNVYGATNGGGSVGDGTVYEVFSGGGESTLYEFLGARQNDGARPQGPVTRDSQGNLYGTTLQGGPSDGCEGFGCGTVFKVDPSGQESVLYRFTGGLDGAYPTGPLIRDSAGNLYGTTEIGGDLTCSLGGFQGCGVVFKVSPTGQETVLHAFAGKPDGANPQGGVVPDAYGNFYGTTVEGGNPVCSGGCGTVFRIDALGNETILHRFAGGADGATPYSGLLRNSSGILFGTTYQGGASTECGSLGCGTIFSLDPAGKETILYTFPSDAGGVWPQSLSRDSAGNIVGTTEFGGDNWGVVFEFSHK